MILLYFPFSHNRKIPEDLTETYESRLLPERTVKPNTWGGVK